MATEVTNYKCPACGGPLHFAGDSGQLECEYCDSSFEVAEIEAMYAEKDARAVETTAGKAKENAADETNWDTSGLSTDWGSDADGMKAYSCPSCGAEIICDSTTAATSCAYCGNPSIVPGQFSGMLKPDYVIPFKLSKDDAIAALKKHYGKKPLLPKVFSESNHIEEVKGVYVPFWMFDASAEGQVTFEATKCHSHTAGGYKEIETDYFDVEREGTLAFEKVPVDAQSKMPDDYMDSIEPYDYADLKSFSTAYLPGYLADKYDVDVEKCYERVDERCKGSFVSSMEDTIKGYDTCTKKDSNIRLNRGKVYYALMPVWFLNTKWNDKDFLFAMNGQTGKLVGDLPVSLKRAFGLFAAIALPLIAIGMAIAGKSVHENPFRTIIFAVLMASVIALIAVGCVWSGMKNVAKKKTANTYISGEVNLTGKSDTFTHKTVTRHKIENSSSSSGDSHSHTSGGESGRSGKF